MDPVIQQLRLLSQNRPLKAVAISAALPEAFGDDVDTLLLEGLALLSPGMLGLGEELRERLERSVLIGWDRISQPGSVLARRQYQPTLRRILEGAATHRHEAIRRKAIDMARSLAGERDATGWAVLRERLRDESIVIVRAAAEAIAQAGERVGISDSEVEASVLRALSGYAKHRSEKILLLVIQHADRAPAALRSWLEADACSHRADLEANQEAAQQAMRTVAKRVPASVLDRQIAAWLGLPCLSLVAVRRLQEASKLACSKRETPFRSDGGEEHPRVSGAIQIWTRLFETVKIAGSATMIDSLQRLGAEVIVEAAIELAIEPSAVGLALSACKSQAQRKSALIGLLEARSPAVRLAAVRELAKLTPCAASDAALAGLARDEAASVACAAAMALSRFSSASRHVRLDPVLSAFAEHHDAGVRRGVQTARRLTDPIGDIVAAAEIPAAQALPWRAPMGVRAMVARDAAAMARSLEKIATDTRRPSGLRRSARLLLNRALPLPTRSLKRSAGAMVTGRIEARGAASSGGMVRHA